MLAPRRPRSPATRGLWRAVAVGAMALAGWMAGLAALVYSTWSAEEQARAAALLAPRAALLVLGWLAGTALMGAGLRWLWQRHVLPPARLAEDAQALLTSPDAPPLSLPSVPALQALATAFNTLREQDAAHRAGLQAQIDQASARVASERNRLAALLAQLA
ncbi:MAG: DNA polymerase III subunit epsilon, partial [Comamonadaceae bacterium]|nr:DNA polymerase III subunit epsilon [Comamonadaceae bacterium]